MKLIVGLGNIGAKYDNTRHNVGFSVADKLINYYQLSSVGSKFHGELFSGNINSQKVLIIKPSTYMNLSGIAVREVANFHKISLEDIIVVHDDLDLKVGKIRFKVGGGDGGHNGLKSIDENISKNYLRLKIGIGRPEFADADIAAYVLGKFKGDEKEIIESTIELIAKLFSLILEGKYNEFTTKFALAGQKKEVKADD